MDVSELGWTDHATERMKQRGCTREQVLSTVEYGRQIRGFHAGIFFYIGRKEVAHYAKRNKDLSGCQDTAVLVVGTSIITVIKTDRPKNLVRGRYKR